MFLTVHASAAALIGKNVANPFLAFILAVISHFIIDMIPHGDKRLGQKLFGFFFNSNKKELREPAVYGIIDTLIMVIYIIYIFNSIELNRLSVGWAIIGGIIPDVLVGIYATTKTRFLKWYFEFHHSMHICIHKFNCDLPLHFGVVFQVALFTVAFWVIHYF